MLYIDILLTALVVIFSLLTVFSKKTVVSAFSLLMTLVSIAGIYYQLGSVFLSAIQVLVNAGAIAILFVFVMMLIDLERYQEQPDKSKVKLILTILTTLVSLGVICLVINNNIDTISIVNLSDTSMKTLFEKLFSKYFIPFELATVLLLAALISVVVISNHDKKIEEEKKIEE